MALAAISGASLSRSRYVVPSLFCQLHRLSNASHRRSGRPRRPAHPSHPTVRSFATAISPMNSVAAENTNGNDGHGAQPQAARAAVTTEQPDSPNNVIRPRKGLRPVVNVPTTEITNWESSNLPPSWIACLKSEGIREPTPIQKQSFHVIASGTSCLLRSETGSGKTLAYLLPLLLRLLPSTLSFVVRKINPLSPSIMIFTKTEQACHHLVAQLKSLPGLGLKCIVIPPPSDVPQTSLYFPDIGVATPETFVRYHQRNTKLYKLLARTEGIVFDEADATVTAEVSKKLIRETLEIRKVRRSGPQGRPERPRPFQYVFSAATLPNGSVRGSPKKDTVKYLLGSIPDIVTVDSAHVHCLPPQLEQRFVYLASVSPIGRKRPADSSEGTIVPPLEEVDKLVYAETVFREKLDLLFHKMAASLKSERNSSALLSDRWIVFCNDRETTERVHAAIRLAITRGELRSTVSFGYVHEGVDDEWRIRSVADFATPEYGAGTQPELHVFVATDAGSRGIDYQFVSTVVNFDFPTNAVDYMQRAGRTARQGLAGTVLSFVAAEDAGLATRIKHVGKGTFAETENGGRGVFTRKVAVTRKDKRDRERELFMLEKFEARGKLKEKGKQKLEALRLAMLERNASRKEKKTV
ncbi:P-loop containing nucleoside triphosphate hydrolase protein [Zopfochytrium polystomum]|nr:P-loop containing nucleoside triphosphate hydrolase protein [Zopfochytrium polystomum]